MIPLKQLFTFVRTQLNNVAFWWDNRSSSVRFWIEAQFGPEARFLKAPITFRAQKPVLCLSCLHSRSIILKMIQWNYQFTKQNWPVCGPGTMLLFNRFWFQNLPLYAKSYRVFRETSPWSQLENKTIPLQYNIRPFYRYQRHIELIRFKEYYRMPRGHEHISFVFSSAFGDIFS